MFLNITFISEHPTVFSSTHPKSDQAHIDPTSCQAFETTGRNPENFLNCDPGSKATALPHRC
ncbi:hypothetical protein WN55_03501 [Dufourea novaeangliae]|uniref:Uncharacterized protein n=1 Tax=Dufourea novaeangliae TaxID=178035 RepID=A0A154PJD4_DUFNO|nr:hypothetical protein WN55_03501 [Dufourea novaeangliae]